MSGLSDMYTHGMLLSHKKESNTAICSNTNGPREQYNEINQTGKDKYYVISLKRGI